MIEGVKTETPEPKQVGRGGDMLIYAGGKGGGWDPNGPHNRLGLFSLVIGQIGSIVVDEDAAIFRCDQKIAVDLEFRALLKRVFSPGGYPPLDKGREPSSTLGDPPRNPSVWIGSGLPGSDRPKDWCGAIRFFDRAEKLVLEITAENIATIDPRDGLSQWMRSQLDEAQA